MAMRKVRVGVIGVAVDRHAIVHLRALSSMSDVELVAFCDVDRTALERACREYRVEQRFLDRREMLETAGMDAVWVVCNWRFTYEVALDCLRAGVNTFVEKPPGLTSQECRDLAEAARESGCKSMVGFNRRFNCVISEAKRLLEGASPISGPTQEGRGIRVVGSEYGKGRFAAVLTDKNGRAVLPLQIDTVHHVDALRYLCGEPEQVTGISTRHYSENLDSFHALIEFRNGAVGHLNSNYHAFKVERLSLFAAEAWASLQGVHEQINEGRVYAHGCWNELKGEALMGRTDALGFWDEDRFFIDCVKEEKPVAYPASDLDDAAKTMELVEAILGRG